MSRDPFEIGKIDSKKAIGQSQGASPLYQIGQNAAAARAGEGAGAPAAPSAPPQVPQSDRVQISGEADESSPSGVSSLLAALGAPSGAPPVTDTADTTKVSKAGNLEPVGAGFNFSQMPPAGMGGGAIGGNGAISGQAPGMSSGGVFTTPRINAA